MTEPHDFDELASAHLDGATSPEEAARVEADPELVARVEELRAVQRALAELPPVDPAQRDAAIRAALAAFDEDLGSGPERLEASVTALTPRRGLSPRAARALSAAAVILILALMVPLLTKIDGDEETASFDSTGDAISGAGDASEEAATDGATAPEAQDSANTTIATESGGVAAIDGSAIDLGTFDDLAALAAAVAAGAEPREQVDTAFTSPPLCAEPADLAAVAVVAGQPVEVYVRRGTDGVDTMTVRARDTCELLDLREI